MMWTCFPGSFGTTKLAWSSESVLAMVTFAVGRIGVGVLPPSGGELVAIGIGGGGGELHRFICFDGPIERAVRVG